ncbi:YjzD family protein [Bacillus cereus]
MRFIWALIWSFLLVHMMSYVIGSMTGGTYDFNQASIFSSCSCTVLVLAISAAIPNEPVEQH